MWLVTTVPSLETSHFFPKDSLGFSGMLEHPTKRNNTDVINPNVYFILGNLHSLAR